MSADLKALLAAVVAEPSDDVARLVYADCLEEHGNIPRAHFIRLQIEAERHHPDSRAHAELAERAHALFAEHWIEWWSEVCAAVGLRAPEPKSVGRLGRLARAVGLRSASGAPYERLSKFTPEAGSHSLPTVEQCAFTVPELPLTFRTASFSRGFPDTVCVESFPVDLTPKVANPLVRWCLGSPLVTVHCDDDALGAPGPHLETLCELDLSGTPDAIVQRLTRQHFRRLESLRITLKNPEADWRVPEFDCEAFARLPCVKRLRRLALPHFDVVPADLMPRLRATEVVFGSNPAPTVHWLTLHASQLEELVVRGISFGDFLVSLGADEWKSLRQFVVNAAYCDVRRWGAVMFDQVRFGYEALFADANLPALEELRVLEVMWTDDFVERMVKSPLLKRLKHFACTAQNVDAVSPAVLRRLPDAFDPERIETVRFRTDHPRPELDELTRAFGDRVRLECGPGYYVPK